MTSYTLLVDGVPHVVDTDEPGASLSQVLRDLLGQRQVKEGCAAGSCGTCSVLLDGALATACTVLAADLHELPVTTSAGLGSAEDPGPVQRALVEAGAVQCGFCTPGLVVAMTALLAEDPRPSEAATRLALSGNLCRCTGYGRVVEAVRRLAGAT